MWQNTHALHVNCTSCSCSETLLDCPTSKQFLYCFPLGMPCWLGCSTWGSPFTIFFFYDKLCPVSECNLAQISLNQNEKWKVWSDLVLFYLFMIRHRLFLLKPNVIWSGSVLATLVPKPIDSHLCLFSNNDSTPLPSHFNFALGTKITQDFTKRSLWPALSLIKDVYVALSHCHPFFSRLVSSFYVTVELAVKSWS